MSTPLNQDKLGIIFFPAFDWALSPTHPERQERLLYTQDQLAEEGLFDLPGIREYRPDLATFDDVERVHFCFPEPSAMVTASHLVSAGAAMRAARLVHEKLSRRAFALTRPPGHHAGKVVHGVRGFCTINIEAVMIEALRERLGPLRVAVIDTDCHHGDGTQDVYWNDPDTLFISIHQDGRTLYPGTGFPSELGGPTARKATLNIPLPPHTGDEGFHRVAERLIKPALERFKPDLVVNSAGQDNHFTDPLTTMNFTAQGYARLAEILNADIAVLEGGYSIQGALPYVNLAICLAMAGEEYAYVAEPRLPAGGLRQDPRVTEYIESLCDDFDDYLQNAPELPGDGRVEGDWFVRTKSIHYDGEGMTDHQTEKVLLCGACKGLVVTESVTSSHGRCLGAEIPLGACPRCEQTGYALTEEAQLKSLARYVAVMDRKNKSYRRFMV